MLTSLRQKTHTAATGNGLKARLIRGGLGSAGIRAANRLTVLVLGIVLARALGAEGYGIYAYAFALMSLLMVVAEAGMPTLLMREVAASEGRKDWGELRGVLRHAARFVTLTSTTISLLGLLVVWWLNEKLTPTVLYTTTLMLLLLPLSAGAKTVAHAMRGLHRVVLGQAIDMLLRPMLVLALIGGIFWLWPDWRQPQIAMAVQLFAALMVLIVGWRILRYLMPSQVKTTQPVYRGREWLSSALPFTLIGGAGVINSYTDIIMLGWFTGPEEVGIYRVAVQGASLVAFSLQVANAVIAPQFSRLYAQGDMARLQRLVTQSARIVLLMAFPVALVFIAIGDTLVGWAFGAEFEAAHMPLVVLTLGQLFFVMMGPIGYLLMMTGKEKFTARSVWLGAGLNVLMNLVLISLFGLVGAAIATAVSNSIMVFFMATALFKISGINSTAFFWGR